MKTASLISAMVASTGLAFILALMANAVFAEKTKKDVEAAQALHHITKKIDAELREKRGDFYTQYTMLRNFIEKYEGTESALTAKIRIFALLKARGRFGDYITDKRLEEMGIDPANFQSDLERFILETARDHPDTWQGAIAGTVVCHMQHATSIGEDEAGKVHDCILSLMPKIDAVERENNAEYRAFITMEGQLRKDEPFAPVTYYQTAQHYYYLASSKKRVEFFGKAEKVISTILGKYPDSKPAKKAREILERIKKEKGKVRDKE